MLVCAKQGQEAVDRQQQPQPAQARPANWTNRLVIADAEALGDFTLRWDDKGTLLRLSDAQGERPLVCTIKRRRSTCIGTPAKVFGQPFMDGVRVTAMLPNTNATATLSLRRSRQRCTLYVDGQPALSFSDLWNGAIALATVREALPDPIEAGFVQRLGHFSFSDDFLIDQASPQALQLWETTSGAWGLHAVTGTLSGVHFREELKRFPKPERSPNFYSLDGHGQNAMILAGEPFYNHYTYRASVQHNAGTNGLLFLMPENSGPPGHAFTVQTDPDSGHLIFALWRGTAAGRGLGFLVEAVVSDCVPGQWLMLEVRVFEDRVVCRVDNIEVIRRRLAFPPGGRFGLFSNAPDGARFDDVRAASHTEIPVDTREDLAPWTRRCTHPLESRSGPLAGFVSPDIPFATQAHLAKTSSSNATEIIFGATNDPPRRIDLAIQPASRFWSADLIAGWRSATQTHYRLSVRQRDGAPTATLFQVAPGVTNRLLDTLVLAPFTNGCVTLTLDATAPEGISGRIDGRTVVWSPLEGTAAGAAGFRLGMETLGVLTLPLSRSDVAHFTDRFEKNNFYVTDPYMRHWASPEGQWLGYPDKRAWYKSDVLRQVELRVPSVNGTILHMLIPEGQTNGVIQVAVSNDVISLSTRFAGGTNHHVVAQRATWFFPESQPVADGPKFRFYTVRLNDGIFTLSSDTSLVARCSVPLPAAGRRMMMEGMETAQLAFTRVIREPVLDCLFTESLHDWNMNGGSWEVINRFQCFPDWSHMNGENSNSVAAIWSKFEIAGDFSMEFYAGMRHGWYDRPGDLNLTIMNRRSTTASGYTLTTAGWDPDESQLWSRFFRNGEPKAQSDRYTVPRTREGNKRKGYEPLLAEGRDVHGAWYALRLRRLGNQLTFDFDNQRILEFNDPEPIHAGSFGIWTYRNSMMVARVRITADAIRPRPFAFSRITRIPPPHASHAAWAVDTNAPALTINGWPAQLLQEPLWHHDEDDNHTRIVFKNATTAVPEMHVYSAQGGGAFMARASLPEIAASELIGWRFEVARHPEAQFNLEYTLGTREGKQFTVIEALSHYICGTLEERGPRRIAGRLPKPPEPTPEGATDLIWTPVVAWLPIQGVSNRFQVRLDGFGNLQPSDIQQGLSGNPPGAWYAVRNLRPIYRGTPVIATTRSPDLAPLREKLDTAPVGRLNTLTLPAELDPARTVIEWGVMPGSDIALVARLATRPPHSIRVASTLPWPNPLLTSRNVRINDQPVPIAWIDANELVVPLPRGIPDSNEAVRLSTDLLDGRTFTQLFSSSSIYEAPGKRPAAPPILIGFDLTNSLSCYQNFESRRLFPSAFQVALPPTIRFDDPRQNSYLRYANSGNAARLQGLLASGYDLARWPLLQFRYRGDPMARVSIHAINSGVIHFSENNPNASEVPLAPQPKLDDTWHTWLGRVSGFTLSRPITSGYSLGVTDLRVGSLHGQDQTGRFSTLNVDDLAAGPVIGPGQNLTFRASYEAPDGIDVCAYSILSGEQPWDLRTAKQREEARWTAITTNTWIAVPTGGIEDGIHHLVLRAKSADSVWSPVADIPFMMDRTPVPVTAQVISTSKLNGTLFNVDFQSKDGASPLMETLKLTCNGTPFPFAQDATSVVNYHTNGITLELNWPLLFRKQINAAGNGTQFAIRCEGLTDAAGNVSPPLSASIKIDYASDKTPPTYPPLATPTNALWWAPEMPAPSDLFTFNRTLVVEPGTSPDIFSFIGLKASDKEGMVGRTFSSPVWSTARHRYLALSLCLAPDTKITTNETLFELRFRPPKVPAGGKRFKRGAYHMTFTSKTLADNRTLFGNLKWEPGRWNDLMVDVAEFLKQESGLAEAFELQEFAIVLPAASPYRLQVRAGAILSAWAATDVLAFRAYDASGVSGLTWQGGGQAPFTVIRPARVSLPADDPCWMKLAIRDRAGNASHPFLVPIPPHAPPPGNLPLAEDWAP
jgi:hypothetical protein